MRILLDTHALHWAVDAPERLGVAGRALLGDPQHEVFVSPISGWELAQHARKGTITFDRPVAAWVDEAVSGLEAVPRPVVKRDAARPFGHEHLTVGGAQFPPDSGE